MNKIKFIFKSLIDFLIYFYYKIIFINKQKENIWLISERGIDARDNGYWFYKYMVSNHPEVTVKYVISKDSADYSKINKKDVVEYRSKMHYYYFLKAKYLISAEIMGYSPNEQLFYRLNKYGILKIKGKTIFLQHGITKDYNPYMTKQNAKLDLFICGAIPEYQYMIEKYGYSEKEVKLTGFARFDELEDENEKIILIMPTWRKWLKYNDSLKNTIFFNKYNQILNDRDIIKKIEENNYKIIFYPHIVMQKFINEFKSKSKNIIIASFKDYDVQDLLKKSSLLITDYSSVAFDYAYMNKKTIYYQFDLDEYRNNQYVEGYFSYPEDGFGPIYYDYNELKQNLINYLKNKKIFDKYNDRISNFFKYNDKKNCERIYNEIKKIKENR